MSMGKPAESEAQGVFVDILIRRTCSWPRFADRRCLWLSMLETGRQRSTRYPGATLCWHLYTWTHSRNRIRSVTSSQC